MLKAASLGAPELVRSACPAVRRTFEGLAEVVGDQSLVAALGAAGTTPAPPELTGAALGAKVAAVSTGEANPHTISGSTVTMVLSWPKT